MRFSRTSEMRRRRRRKVKVKVKKKARGGERIGEKERERESKRATVKKGVSFGHRISLFSVLWSAKFSHTQTEFSVRGLPGRCGSSGRPLSLAQKKMMMRMWWLWW